MDTQLFTNSHILAWLQYYAEHTEVDLEKIKILDITRKNKNLIPTVESHSAVLVFTEAGHKDIFYRMWEAGLGKCTVWYNEGSDPSGPIKKDFLKDMINRGSNASAEIPQYFAQYVANGQVDTEYVTVESEHSSMSTCMGAQAAGIVGRAMTRALDKGDKAVICNATGCLEVSSFLYPFTAWEDSYIHSAFENVLAPCPRGWQYSAGLLPEICKMAVETCVWPLYEVIEGKWHLSYEPKKKLPVTEFMKLQGGFKHCFQPGNEWTLEAVQQYVDEKREKLLAKCH